MQNSKIADTLLESIDITVAPFRVVRFETLIVLVFDVSVGALDGDVHAFADGRVGEVVSGRVVGTVTGHFAS